MGYTQAEPEVERLYWSIHEAGHAVAAAISGYSIDCVTLAASDASLVATGTVYHDKGAVPGDEATDDAMAEDLRRMLRVDVAGAVAEYIAHTGDEHFPPLPYGREVEEDGRLTEALMTEPLQINDAFLESFKEYPEVFGEEFGSRKIVFPTTAMLAQSWGAVVEVARHLREQGVVEGAEVHAIVRQERA